MTVFTYVNAHKKNTHGNEVCTFKQQGNLLHFSDMLHILFCFPQNAIYFIILSFSVQIICFSYTVH